MQWTPAARAELSINNSGTRQRCAAGGSEREGSQGERATHGQDGTRAAHTSGTRALLAFVVWLAVPE